MQGPDFAGAEQYAVRRLAGERASALVYLTVAHTRDDLLPAVERLAAAAGMVGTDFGLLRIAAYFHDLGFVEQRAEHEAASARIAAATLPGFGFRPAQARAVGNLIRATRLPQTPHNHRRPVVWRPVAVSSPARVSYGGRAGASRAGDAPECGVLAALLAQTATGATG